MKIVTMVARVVQFAPAALRRDGNRMQACDFFRSYFHFRVDLDKQPAITMTKKQPFTMNHVRIPLECRCVLTDPKGAQTQYVLGASCKTELVNVRKDMWMLPNADFAPIASAEDFLIIKRWARHEPELTQDVPGMAKYRERQVGKTRDAWHQHRLDVVMAEAMPLTSAKDLFDATLSNRVLVSRTEIELDKSWRALIEYPVKTINVSDRDGYYQVDTGPVLFPAIEDESSPIAGFRLAYIAHNAPDWAEFIVNVPTEVTGDVAVNHYSKSVAVAARNQMLLLG